MYTLQMMKHDSRRAISNYRFRQFIKTNRFKALLVLAVPFLMLARFGQKKEIGLLMAVGMSAALLPVHFA